MYFREQKPNFNVLPSNLDNSGKLTTNRNYFSEEERVKKSGVNGVDFENYSKPFKI